MKKIITIFILLLLLGIVVGCEKAPTEDEEVEEEEPEEEVVEEGPLGMGGLEEYTTDLSDLDTDLEELDW